MHNFNNFTHRACKCLPNIFISKWCVNMSFRVGLYVNVVNVVAFDNIDLVPLISK